MKYDAAVNWTELGGALRHLRSALDVSQAELREYLQKQSEQGQAEWGEPFSSFDVLNIELGNPNSESLGKLPKIFEALIGVVHARTFEYLSRQAGVSQ